MDHLFLHCPYTIGLWHKLFNSSSLVWVPPKRIEEMFIIAFKGFGSSIRSKTLWQIACLSLVWFGLFGKREIQGFSRIKIRRKRKCETYFIFFHPCGLHVPLY